MVTDRCTSIILHAFIRSHVPFFLLLRDKLQLNRMIENREKRKMYIKRYLPPVPSSSPTRADFFTRFPPCSTISVRPPRFTSPADPPPTRTTAFSPPRRIPEPPTFREDLLPGEEGQLCERLLCREPPAWIQLRQLRHRISCAFAELPVHPALGIGSVARLFADHNV